eukprot:m.37708 g.37708  ORF g.37708 m.37708 type:complete len:345 (+) comp11127_c1_seq2:3-1037(+)
MELEMEMALGDGGAAERVVSKAGPAVVPDEHTLAILANKHARYGTPLAALKSLERVRRAGGIDIARSGNVVLASSWIRALTGSPATFGAICALDDAVAQWPGSGHGEGGGGGAGDGPGRKKGKRSGSSTAAACHHCRDAVYVEALLQACERRVAAAERSIRGAPEDLWHLDTALRRWQWVGTDQVDAASDGAHQRAFDTLTQWQQTAGSSATTTTPRMLLTMLQLCQWRGDGEAARQLWQQAEQQAAPNLPSSKALAALSVALARSADLETLKQVFDRYEAAKAAIPLGVIKQLITTFGRNRMIDEAMEVYDAMVRQQLSPDEELNRILIDVCGIDPLSVAWNA